MKQYYWYTREIPAYDILSNDIMRSKEGVNGALQFPNLSLYIFNL